MAGSTTSADLGTCAEGTGTAAKESTTRTWTEDSTETPVTLAMTSSTNVCLGMQFREAPKSFVGSIYEKGSLTSQEFSIPIDSTVTLSGIDKIEASNIASAKITSDPIDGEKINRAQPDYSVQVFQQSG